MIKGIGKQIIQLVHTESDEFEQIIFILKPDHSSDHGKIVKECERIMHQHLKERKGQKTNRWKVGFFILLSIIPLLIVALIIK